MPKFLYEQCVNRKWYLSNGVGASWVNLRGKRCAIQQYSAHKLNTKVLTDMCSSPYKGVLFVCARGWSLPSLLSDRQDLWAMVNILETKIFSLMSDPVVLLHKPNQTMSENWKKGISKKNSFPKDFYHCLWAWLFFKLCIVPSYLVLLYTLIVDLNEKVVFTEQFMYCVFMKQLSCNVYSV